MTSSRELTWGLSLYAERKLSASGVCWALRKSSHRFQSSVEQDDKNKAGVLRKIASRCVEQFQSDTASALSIKSIASMLYVPSTSMYTIRLLSPSSIPLHPSLPAEYPSANEPIAHVPLVFGSFALRAEVFDAVRCEGWPDNIVLFAGAAETIDAGIGMIAPAADDQSWRDSSPPYASVSHAPSHVNVRSRSSRFPARQLCIDRCRSEEPDCLLSRGWEFCVRLCPRLG
jgi:hypothetical protein